MFYYHKIKYSSANNFQINNLLHIIRNQEYNNYDEDIYISKISIVKKQKQKQNIKYKFIRKRYLEKYSYLTLPSLFFSY